MAKAKQEIIKAEIIIDASDEKKINATISRVSKKLDSIQRGYLSIVGDVAYLNEIQAYRLSGYKSIYTFCREKFGISRGMVHNLLSIYDRYGENYELTDEAKELSCRQMLAQIKEEKKALEAKTAESASPEDQKKKDKRKHETILDFNFKNATDWDGCELMDYLTNEIDSSLQIPEGAKITITITT